MSKSKVDWTEVARLYANGSETVDDICKRFSVTRSTLYRQAKKHRWTKRNLDQGQRQTDFVARMFSVLNRQLDQLDQRISSEGPIDVSTLANIAKTFEKIVELGATVNTTAQHKSDGRALKLLRDLLAQNIKNLHEHD